MGGSGNPCWQQGANLREILNGCGPKKAKETCLVLNITLSQGSLFSFHYGVCMETHLKNDSSNPISCLRQFYRSGPICFVQRWPSESHGTVFPGMNLEPTTTEQWKEGFLLSFSLGRQLCFQWLQSNDVLQPESRRYRCPISSNSHGSYYPFPFSFG